MPVVTLLAAASRHGRTILALGLVAGVLLPGIAFAMKPLIQEMVAALLFLAALRVGPRQAFGALSDLRTSVGFAVLFQIILPLAAIALIALSGLSGALAVGIVIMLAASPISGSPNLAVMTGHDPAPALRQLVVGTAILPLTVIPVFWLTPEFGDPATVFRAAGGLMLLIAAAAGLAFAIRATILKSPSRKAMEAMDGLSAIAMAIVVVGLMSAVGPGLFATPMRVLAMLAAVCAINFGLQVAVARTALQTRFHALAATLGIVAGNRNIALFLGVLPLSVTEPLLLFIGCYQIPMYLTPAALGWFYKKRAPAP